MVAAEVDGVGALMVPDPDPEAGPVTAESLWNRSKQNVSCSFQCILQNSSSLVENPEGIKMSGEPQMGDEDQHACAVGPAESVTVISSRRPNSIKPLDRCPLSRFSALRAGD